MTDRPRKASPAPLSPPAGRHRTGRHERRFGRRGVLPLPIFAAVAAVAVALAGSACRSRASGPTVTLVPRQGAPTTVTVEVVTTPQERERGLMYREELDPSSGMLFVFPATQNLSFWMRNTKIPLDILFIDDAGTIVRIHRRTRPFSETSLPSGRPARFALELVGGTADRIGIAEGDRVELGALATTPAT